MRAFSTTTRRGVADELRRDRQAVLAAVGQESRALLFAAGVRRRYQYYTVLLVVSVLVLELVQVLALLY